MFNYAETSSVAYIFNKMLLNIGKQVEFDLPEELKKRKHTPYTFIRRNVYLIKRAKKRIEDDGIFCTCTPSAGSSVCGKDCHCGMLLSSCSPSCKCGDACLNKPFQQRTIKKVKLVKTEKCGSGLVADEDIKKGDFVVEYVGEVIDDKTCEERLWSMKHRGETNFYLCEINRDMVIDATYKGNKSRYINHSCEPNTEMQKWRIDGETRIGIFAIRNIKKGEHLTYDYQFVQFGADQNCYCGSVGCRQKLGTKSNKPKTSSDSALAVTAQEVTSNGGLDTGKSHGISYQKKIYPWNCVQECIQIHCSHGRRNHLGYILSFDDNSRQHTILFEDGDVGVIDLSKVDWDILAI